LGSQLQICLCPHATTSSVVKEEKNPANNEKIYIKCTICGTEIRFRSIEDGNWSHRYQVSRWFDLGYCRCPLESQWNAVAGELSPTTVAASKEGPMRHKTRV